MLTVRARALLDGRLAPSVADVAALARPVLTHRMALNFAARARGETLRRRDRPHGGPQRWGMRPRRDRYRPIPARAGRKRLAQALPPLLAAAEHLAATVILGRSWPQAAGHGR